MYARALDSEFAREVRAGLTRHERFGLRQAVRDGEILLRLIAARGPRRQQEIQRGTRAALVQQLKKRVLRVVAGFTPDHGRCLPLHGTAVE